MPDRIATVELRCFNARRSASDCWGTGTIQPGEPYRVVNLPRVESAVFCLACCRPKVEA